MRKKGWKQWMAGLLSAAMLVTGTPIAQAAELSETSTISETDSTKLVMGTTSDSIALHEMESVSVSYDLEETGTYYFKVTCTGGERSSYEATVSGTKSAAKTYKSTYWDDSLQIFDTFEGDQTITITFTGLTYNDRTLTVESVCNPPIVRMNMYDYGLEMKYGSSELTSDGAELYITYECNSKNVSRYITNSDDAWDEFCTGYVDTDLDGNPIVLDENGFIPGGVYLRTFFFGEYTGQQTVTVRQSKAFPGFDTEITVNPGDDNMYELVIEEACTVQMIFSPEWYRGFLALKTADDEYAPMYDEENKIWKLNAGTYYFYAQCDQGAEPITFSLCKSEKKTPVSVSFSTKPAKTEFVEGSFKTLSVRDVLQDAVTVIEYEGGENVSVTKNSDSWYFYFSDDTAELCDTNHNSVQADSLAVGSYLYHVMMDGYEFDIPFSVIAPPVYEPGTYFYGEYEATILKTLVVEEKNAYWYDVSGRAGTKAEILDAGKNVIAPNEQGFYVLDAGSYTMRITSSDSSTYIYLYEADVVELDQKEYHNLYDEEIYSFVPAESGEYYFAADYSDTLAFDVCDEDGNILASAEKVINNLETTVELSAGDIYFVHMTSAKKSGSENFYFSAAHKADSVSIRLETSYDAPLKRYGFGGYYESESFNVVVTDEDGIEEVFQIGTIQADEKGINDYVINAETKEKVILMYSTDKYPYGKYQYVVEYKGLRLTVDFEVVEDDKLPLAPIGEAIELGCWQRGYYRVEANGKDYVVSKPGYNSNVQVVTEAGTSYGANQVASGNGILKLETKYDASCVYYVNYVEDFELNQEKTFSVEKDETIFAAFEVPADKKYDFIISTNGKKENVYVDSSLVTANRPIELQTGTTHYLKLTGMDEGVTEYTVFAKKTREQTGVELVTDLKNKEINYFGSPVFRDISIRRTYDDGTVGEICYADSYGYGSDYVYYEILRVDGTTDYASRGYYKPGEYNVRLYMDYSRTYTVMTNFTILEPTEIKADEVVTVAPGEAKTYAVSANPSTYYQYLTRQSDILEKTIYQKSGYEMGGYGKTPSFYNYDDCFYVKVTNTGDEPAEFTVVEKKVITSIKPVLDCPLTTMFDLCKNNKWKDHLYFEMETEDGEKLRRPYVSDDLFDLQFSYGVYLLNNDSSVYGPENNKDYTIKASLYRDYETVEGYSDVLHCGMINDFIDVEPGTTGTLEPGNNFFRVIPPEDGGMYAFETDSDYLMQYYRDYDPTYDWNWFEDKYTTNQAVSYRGSEYLIRIYNPGEASTFVFKIPHAVQRGYFSGGTYQMYGNWSEKYVTDASGEKVLVPDNTTPAQPNTKYTELENRPELFMPDRVLRVKYADEENYKIVEYGSDEWNKIGLELRSLYRLEENDLVTAMTDENGYLPEGQYLLVYFIGNEQIQSTFNIITERTLKLTWSFDEDTYVEGYGYDYLYAGAVGINLTYQWQKSVDGKTWNDIPGATKTELDASKHVYELIRYAVTNPVTKETLYSEATYVMPENPLSISRQPADCEVSEGESGYFGLWASGTKISFQWQMSRDGGKTWTNNAGETARSDFFVINEVSTDYDGWLFRCEVTDFFGCVEYSDVVTLTVLSAPLSIVKQPGAVRTTDGEKVTYTVEADGENLTYQWQFSKDEGKTWSTSTLTSAKTANLSFAAKESYNGRLYRCIISNGKRSITTNEVRLYVEAKPAIITQPKDTTVTESTTAKFSVVAENATAYQWQFSKDGGKTWSNSTVTSAKTATLSFKALLTYSGRIYRCIVTTANGNVNSETAVLTVTAGKPAITTQPADITVVTGKTAKFSVTATGENLTYQWQVSADGGKTWSNSAATSAKTATLSFIAKDSYNGRIYRCVVTNAAGNATTETATLTVDAGKPAITTQPVDTTVVTGKTAKFSVVASGQNLTYQWKVSKDGGKTWANSTVTSAKTATLSFVAAESYSGRQYCCVVTNASGSVTTETVTLKVEAAKPVITTQPANATVLSGKNVKFSVIATGANLTYQWQVSTDGGKTWANSTATSAKTATLSFTAKESYNGRQYRCVVKNASGSVTTATATLTVGAEKPVITTQPQDTTVAAGKTAKFSIVAEGATAYKWQFSKDGKTWTTSTLTSAKTANVSFIAKDTYSGRLYRCVVTYDGKEVVSDTAVLTVQ